MKTLLALSFLLLGMIAHADIPGYTQVSDEKVYDYKKAIYSAIQAAPNASSACNPNWLNEAFHMTSEVFVKDGSQQPLLIFNSFFGYAGMEMRRLIFTTAADLKTLTKVQAEVYHWEQFNNGTLANPEFKMDYVIKGQWDCARHP